MAHLTAGDIKPIYANSESTYGTPAATVYYHGDVAEGGAIRFTDTCNPHLAWRYGSRTFSPDDYVSTQVDAGFTAQMEVRDVSGWTSILSYAYKSFGTSLPARTVYIGTSDANEFHVYTGVKTDSLVISADSPGGIVRFDETALAAGIYTTTPTVVAAGDAAAVQWLGGVDLAGTTVYPQRFSISIRNNLERIRGPAPSSSYWGDTATVALVEGRCEIDFEMEVWLDDFNYIDEAVNNTSTSSASLSIGSSYPKTLTLTDLRHVADGQNPDLKQDKMTQTLRYRVGSLSVA